MKSSLISTAIGSLFQQADGTAASVAPAATQPAVKPPPPAAPYAGVIMSPAKFHFKKNELGEKRPTVELFVPLPSWDGVVAALNNTTAVTDKDGKEVKTKNADGSEVTVTIGAKVKDLILDLLSGSIIGAARDQVSDEKAPVNKQEELKMEALKLEAIALIPPSERRGGGISKETWADFFKDYVAVMPEKTGKKAEQVENAAKLFVARLQPVKTQKKILSFLKDQINLWFTSTSTDSQEEFAEVYEFLTGKIDEFMKRDEAELLANL